MRVTRVRVADLFGVFTHDVELKVDERITIIHGPNGYGKTMLLSMIDQFFGGLDQIFFQVPFTAFSVWFDNGSRVTIEKSGQADLESGLSGFTAAMTDASGETRGPADLLLPMPNDTGGGARTDLAGLLRRAVPNLLRVGSREWRVRGYPEVFGPDEALARSAYFLPPRTLRWRDPPAWLEEIRASIPVEYIHTQRLLTAERRRGDEGEAEAGETPAITRYAQSLKREIDDVVRRYASLSEKLDSSFPQRLLFPESGADSARALPIDEIKARFAHLQSKRRSLMEIGLLDREQLDFRLPQAIDDSTAAVLSLYLNDVERKLGVFDDLAARIRLFEKSLNARFLYKRAAISKDRGFTFFSSVADQARQEERAVEGSHLSSGEQHEVVMLYRLLFDVERDSLVLIDEPEISLHLAWQEDFLANLQEMAALSGFDTVIATHSPSIVGSRWDLTVELTGPAGQ